jgi:diguanylate cyclase (GGDEF)-like protein
MQLRGDDPVGVPRWPIWSLPRAVLSIIVVVEVLAIGLIIVGVVRGYGPVHQPWLIMLVVLTGAGIVSTEASLGVERIRRQSDETPHIDLSSVWTFAAAVLLPGMLATVVVLVIYGYMYLRVWRSAQVPLHRVLFSTATVVLAVQASAAVIGYGAGPDPFHSISGLVFLILGLLAYAAVNMTLIVAAIVLSGPNRSWATFRQVLGHGDDAVLEFATLSMGALSAGAMAMFGPAYAVLVLPPLIVLHRTVLVRQLEEEASTDGKTGLLNAAAWHIEADRAVRRVGRFEGNATVLLLDLDNFKQVNDQHGHLVGDQVLVAVARAIEASVRDDDLVGRFGGEEFVVLLPAPDGDPGRIGAEAAANRIRQRIERLRIEVSSHTGDIVICDLSVSIGGATSPTDGSELAELLRVADAAMYAAKHAGRNRVVMGLHAIGRTGGDADPAQAEG